MYIKFVEDLYLKSFFYPVMSKPLLYDFTEALIIIISCDKFVERHYSIFGSFIFLWIAHGCYLIGVV